MTCSFASAASFAQPLGSPVAGWWGVNRQTRSPAVLELGARGQRFNSVADLGGVDEVSAPLVESLELSGRDRFAGRQARDTAASRACTRRPT